MLYFPLDQIVTMRRCIIRSSTPSEPSNYHCSKILRRSPIVMFHSMFRSDWCLVAHRVARLRRPLITFQRSDALLRPLTLLNRIRAKIDPSPALDLLRRTDGILSLSRRHDVRRRICIYIYIHINLSWPLLSFGRERAASLSLARADDAFCFSLFQIDCDKHARRFFFFSLLRFQSITCFIRRPPHFLILTMPPESICMFDTRARARATE